MRRRCNGVLDLGAAKARYHKDCYNNFRKNPDNVFSVKTPDHALKKICEEIHSNRFSNTWSTSELFEKYKEYDGELQSQRQVISNIKAQLGEDYHVLPLEGPYSSVLGHIRHIGKVLKIVKAQRETDDNEDALVKKIKAEVKLINSDRLHKDYDLGDFTKERIMQQTSPTLLRLVSKLVSDGEISKPALSLSQSIQYNIDGKHNQTTLGTGVKLHHRHGSRDLIDDLHSHGRVADYNEILRFRKSCAKFTRHNPNLLHRLAGLSKEVVVIFGWYDNVDMFLSNLMAAERRTSCQPSSKLILQV